MTFRLSPGIYLFTDEVSSQDTNSSPIAMVGAFKKGSLTPTRILVGRNDTSYGLDKQHLDLGYSTIVAQQACRENTLIIKRVVSKEARTATASLFKYKTRSTYNSRIYDDSGNLLEPSCIFFEGEVIEDWSIRCEITIQGWSEILVTTAFDTDHNTTVKKFANELQTRLQEIDEGFKVLYDNLQPTIDTLYIYPPYGYHIERGVAEIFFDLEPMELDAKLEILDSYINAKKIAQEDRSAIAYLLETETFYKASEVQQFLDDWIAKNYLSKTAVENYLNRQLVVKQITSAGITSFYVWASGRQYTRKSYESLQSLIDTWKPTYYMTESDIRDVINSQVDILITSDDVETIITRVFEPNNWLYSSDLEVIQTIVMWAEQNLVSKKQKDNWIQQFIFRGEIRPQDKQEITELLYAKPCDNILQVQLFLGKYCEDTYMTTEEKQAVVQPYLDAGDIDQEDFDKILDMCNYLIRKDESNIIDEYVLLYIEGKVLTNAQIEAWVDGKVSSGYLLSADKQAFMTFLLNGGTTYNYHHYSELQDMLDGFTGTYYWTQQQFTDFVNSKIGVDITSEDATAILNSITTKVAKPATVKNLVNQYANKYMTKQQIEAFVNNQRVRPQDVPDIMELFDGMLILLDDFVTVASVVNGYIEQHYITDLEKQTIIESYSTLQSSNPIYVLEEDINRCFTSTYLPIYLKGQDELYIQSIIAWSTSYYITVEAQQQVFKEMLDNGETLYTFEDWVDSALYAPGLFASTDRCRQAILEYTKTLLPQYIINTINTETDEYLKQIKLATTLTNFKAYDDSSQLLPEPVTETLPGFLIESYDGNTPVPIEFDTLPEVTQAFLSSEGFTTYSSIQEILAIQETYPLLKPQEIQRVFSFVCYNNESGAPVDHDVWVYENSLNIVWRYDEWIDANLRLTLTINPTPSDSTVTIDGEQTSTKQYKYKQTATYNISHYGYYDIDGTQLMDNYYTLTPTLLKKSYTLTVTSNVNATITLADQSTVGTSLSKTDLYETVIPWSVQAEGYVSQSGNHTLTQDETKAITLVLKQYPFTINSNVNADIVIDGDTTSDATTATKQVNHFSNISWSVSKIGYVSQSGTESNITGPVSKNITLQRLQVTFTLTTNIDCDITLNDEVHTNTRSASITVYYGDTVNWSADDGSTTQTGSEVITSDTTKNITL